MIPDPGAKGIAVVRVLVDAYVQASTTTSSRSSYTSGPVSILALAPAPPSPRAGYADTTVRSTRTS